MIETQRNEVLHMDGARETIQVAAGDIPAELLRRGIAPSETVTLTVESELISGDENPVLAW
jgi:uncharacterized protein with PhoU and TrkA domain